MLRALELVGFKSFADKTRFEFPQGITVVVGPNGSGKSNVVDAIKWVLGEQSVKSLRGKEMADVIFNGSGTRRPLNSAEATLTFDNVDRLLPLDAPEVHITRRVFRNGEGEYLINRQPCRLRDIRELFAGTGVATEAYSVIEQGKVDGMLQSSPRERRAIFEEAAGISRFKMKKLEALRRLERVEQNLLRLSDIVDEVDNRLKGVRMQATKARRYREYADRLQYLRTHVGLVDWRALTARLTLTETELEAVRGELAASTLQAEGIDGQIAALENEIARFEHDVRTRDAHVAQNLQRVALLETTNDHQRQRCREMEEQVSRLRRQLAALTFRAGDTTQQQQTAIGAAELAAERRRSMSADLANQERVLTELTSELDRLRNESQQRRTAHVEQTRGVASLSHEINKFETQLAGARGALQRCAARIAELQSTRDKLVAELAQLESRQRALQAGVDQRVAEVQAAQLRLAQSRIDAQSAQAQLAALRQRRSGASERGAVLEELEHRQEGISGGVKQILATARGQDPGRYAGVQGMLADLIRVSVDAAAPLEAALGRKAQHVVVAPGGNLIESLSADMPTLEGRVGFFCLDQIIACETPATVELGDQPGVVERADRLVEAAPELKPLLESLLAHTWVVDDLAAALQLAAGAGGGQHLVTLAGEVLSADGTLNIGPRQSTTGLISRRSELRAVQLQLAELQTKIAQAEVAASDLSAIVARQDQELDQAIATQRDADATLREHQMQTTAAAERQVQLAAQHAAIESEQRLAEQDCQRSAASLAQTQTKLSQAETRLAAAESRINENVGRIEAIERQRSQRHRETMAAKVELAKLEQQLESLQGQLRRHEQEQHERQRSMTDTREQLQHCIDRAGKCESEILLAESEIADRYLRKERFHSDSATATATLEGLRASRAAIAQESQKLRNRLRRSEEKLHKKELEAGEIRHQRTTLADRLRDDYGINLQLSEQASQADAIPEQPDVPPADSLVRSDVEAEIAELRQKIGSIGGVNLDALEEADELDARYQSLAGQLADLTSAKNSLEQIIHKINADSRRLFAETLETVKGHFQGLFRKLFGGGQADIVLDEGVDILESGIEIVARPPGKEPRNISLLSGGEKTLTCVALLLSIFRSRPSPFCVLDEVDAALDEANIQRFIGVLTEFLAWTQFVVVTHSKKTMTCASTLYGVTMQESGVSKRVSVRFEDVSETGEILRTRDEPAGERPSDEQAA